MASTGRRRIIVGVGSVALTALRKFARRKERRIRALVDEPAAFLMERRNQRCPRSHVVAAYRTSLERFSPLYMKLAE